MSKNTNKKAFSIIEVLVCLAIISLLLCGSFLRPSFLSRSALEKQSQELLEIINYQAIEASVKNNQRIIGFSLPDKVYFNDINFSQGRKNLFRLSKNFSFISAKFANISGAEHELILREDGSASPGTIIIADKNNKICIITQAMRGLRTIKCKK